jgi:CBS domain-containing protein
MAIIRVGELISGRLIYIGSENNVIKAAILMRENNISSLLVKHKGDFVSIVQYLRIKMRILTVNPQKLCLR